MGSPTVGDATLEQARDVVSRHLEPTPLVPFHGVGLDVPVFLKCEGMQPTGSFKVRGALAALTAYGANGRSIVTASAGNHALGVAHAAALLGRDATVVVPETGSPAKIGRLRSYPITLVLAGEDYDGAEGHALSLAADGMRYVSAYNDPHVIAGQATLVGEVAEQLGVDCTIVAPAGGGGLLSGTALGARLARQEVRVVGVESAACHAVSAAVAAGHVVSVPVGDTIADGLVGNLEPDSVTPGIVRDLGVTLTDVDEPAIRRAVRELALSAGVVAEGSAAAALAALRAGRVPLDRPVVLIISGRNIATEPLAAILAG